MSQGANMKVQYILYYNYKFNDKVTIFIPVATIYLKNGFIDSLIINYTNKDLSKVRKAKCSITDYYFIDLLKFIIISIKCITRGIIYLFDQTYNALSNYCPLLRLKFTAKHFETLKDIISQLMPNKDFEHFSFLDTNNITDIEKYFSLKKTNGEYINLDIRKKYDESLLLPTSLNKKILIYTKTRKFISNLVSCKNIEDIVKLINKFNNMFKIGVEYKYCYTNLISEERIEKDAVEFINMNKDDNNNLENDKKVKKRKRCPTEDIDTSTCNYLKKSNSRRGLFQFYYYEPEYEYFNRDFNSSSFYNIDINQKLPCFDNIDYDEYLQIDNDILYTDIHKQVDFNSDYDDIYNIMNENSIKNISCTDNFIHDNSDINFFDESGLLDSEVIY